MSQPQFATFKDILDYRRRHLEAGCPMTAIPPVELPASDFDALVDRIEETLKPDPRADPDGRRLTEWRIRKLETKQQRCFRMCGIDFKVESPQFAPTGLEMPSSN